MLLYTFQYFCPRKIWSRYSIRNINVKSILTSVCGIVRSRVHISISSLVHGIQIICGWPQRIVTRHGNIPQTNSVHVRAEIPSIEGCDPFGFTCPPHVGELRVAAGGHRFRRSGFRIGRTLLMAQFSEPTQR